MGRAAAERFWTVIEEYCVRRTGRPRPVRHIARRTGIPSSTLSDWFRDRYVPEWEKTERLLRYFAAEWHSDLRILWQAAWQEEQRQERPAEPDTGADRDHGPGQGQPPPAGTRRPGRRVLVGVSLLVGVAIGAALIIVWQNLRGDAPVAGAPPARCAFVTVATSAVFVSIDDAKPLKFKFEGDVVRLVKVPARRRGGSEYVAVALPARGESATGYGWMRRADLSPDAHDCR